MRLFKGQQSLASPNNPDTETPSEETSKLS